MKKLALALMCLVSLAFFASCNPEGQPSIHAYIEEGYVTDGDIVYMGDEINFGFVVASSPVTGSALSNLVVKLDDDEWDNINLNGETDYTYTSSVQFRAKEIVGECVITAIVTDAAGQTATCTMTLSIDGENPGGDDTPLLGTTFNWMRTGGTLNSAAEMKAVGLDWPGNYKDEVFVTIKPLAGCSMYIIEDGDEYDAITTVGEKEAYFSDLMENAVPDEKYNEISAWAADREYNTMLAVIDAEGETHLIHFTRATVESGGGAGAKITLYGEKK